MFSNNTEGLVLVLLKGNLPAIVKVKCDFSKVKQLIALNKSACSNIERQGAVRILSAL